MYQPSFAYSRLSQGVAGNALTRDNGLSATYKSPDPPTRFLPAKTSSEPRESIFQSHRYASENSGEPSRWDYRRNDQPNYQKSLYSLHRTGTDSSQSLKYGTSVARNLAASGAHDLIDFASRSLNSAPGRYAESYERTSINKNSPRSNLANVLHRNSDSPDSNPVSNLEERKALSSLTRSPQLCDILRQELGDEEEHIGHLVENQLERYINKIRSLHRGGEPQSLEEIDHEQNTSGDLLNVSLSDDGLDLLVEDKPRETLLPQHLENVLALASDLANQTATNAISVANNMYQNSSSGDKVEGNDAEVNAALNRERNKSDEQIVVPEAEHQLASINRLLDQTESHEKKNVSSSEKHESLAKNGISREVAKPPSELAPRPTRNIREIAKLIPSSEDTDQGECASGRIGADPVNEDDSTSLNRHILSQAPEDKRDNFSRRSSSLKKSQYKLASGEERENDENLHDVVEDLEPWNLSALERRVQEIILNDEAQDNFVSRGLERKIDATSRRSEQKHEDLAFEEIVEPEATEKTEFIVENKEAAQPVDSWENNDQTEEGTKIQEGSEPPELQQSSSGPAADSKAELQEEAITQLREEESPEEINYLTNNGADPNVDYQPNQADVNHTNQTNSYPNDPPAEYAYNADGQYRVPDEEYSQYNLNDGLQYDEDQGQQYEYSNKQYVQDPNQQNYVQDPTQGTYAPNSDKEIYNEDVNQQNYMQDPNQQTYAENFTEENYTQDVTQQNYVQDPNQQEWVEDPNQQYDVDVNQQFVQDQQYLNDLNQEYSAVPGEQYAADPNDQYLGDEQYPAQPNEAYSGDYVQGASEDYPTPSADNPYPKAAADLGAHEDSAVAYESPENLPEANNTTRKTKDVIKSILDSDTDTTIEKNVSNTDSDFDFN